MAKTKEEWLNTIQGLLAKAEDPATTEDERLILMDKAFYLIAKFGIDEANLKAKENVTVEVVVRRYKKVNPYALDRMFLLQSIAMAFGCTLINDYTRNQVLIIIGHEDDQERVFMLYGSLLMQMITACELDYVNKPADVHGRAYKASFIKGFRIRASQRIRDAYARARKDAQSESTGTDVVLYNRAAAVKIKVREQFPNLVRRAHSSRTSVEGAYNSGQAAANRADIGQTRMGSRAVRQLGA